MAKRSKKPPTSSKEKLVTAAIKSLGGNDDVWEIYGPTTIAEKDVYEVWVEDKEDQLATRFVEETPDGEFIPYETFQQLAVKLAKQHQALLERSRAEDWARLKELSEMQSRESVEQSRQALELARVQGQNALDTAKASSDRVERTVKLCLAAAGFAIVLPLLAYIALTSPSYWAWAPLFVLLCVMATAAAWAYGDFRTVSIPAPWWSKANADRDADKSKTPT